VFAKGLVTTGHIAVRRKAEAVLSDSAEVVGERSQAGGGVDHLSAERLGPRLRFSESRDKVVRLGRWRIAPATELVGRFHLDPTRTEVCTDELDALRKP